MPLVLSITGRRAFIAKVLPLLKQLQLRLFVNDILPTALMNAVDFTEPTFPGYSPRPAKTWTPAYINADNYAEVDAPKVTWTVGIAGGNDQVFGYWLTDVSGAYILAERFADPPIPMQLAGATCSVTLRVLSGPLA